MHAFIRTFKLLKKISFIPFAKRLKIPALNSCMHYHRFALMHVYMFVRIDHPKHKSNNIGEKNHIYI